MDTKYRELTEEERNGNFHFTSEELKGKSIIQVVSERCTEGLLAEIEKIGNYFRGVNLSLEKH